MSQRVFALALITATAALRRPGYVEAIRQAGSVVGDFVTLEEADFQRIRKVYRPAAGLGDTLARCLDPIGGAAYKKWYLATFGKPCGCTERQEHLNQLFPY